MATIDDIGALAKGEAGRQKIRLLVLQLGIFIGLDFEEQMWGKRPVRRLRLGVIAFGQENLPVEIHGHSRVNLPVQRRIATHCQPLAATHKTLTQLRRVAGARRCFPIPTEA